MSLQIDDEFLIQSFPLKLKESYSSVYSSLAALAALSYDIILSMDLEVEVIWMEKWSIPKVLYLLCRYLGLTGMIFTALEVVGAPPVSNHCQVLLDVRYVILAASAVAVELILLVRIYALYSRNKPVLILTGLLLLGVGGASILLLAVFLKSMRAKVISEPGTIADSLLVKVDRLFPGCYTAANSNNPEPGNVSRFFWIPLLIFESYMFALTLFRFFQSLRGHRNSGLTIAGDRTGIFTVFYRDGTIYFAVIFVSLLFKVLITNFSTTPVALAISGWTPVIFSIAGPRLLLNLRFVNKMEEQHGGSSSTGEDIGSRLVAAPNPVGSHASIEMT